MGCARLIFMYEKDMNHKNLSAMLGCWAVMVAFWIGAWFQDWLAALFSMLANGYFLFSLWFFWYLYPEKSRRD